MKKISIVTPCYNEEGNVEELIRRVASAIPENYEYQHIFIDNASTDNTVRLLRKFASENKRIKLILNAGNYGHIRSPYYGLLQSDADATMMIVADLQDPPELIPEFIRKWENGSSIVIGVKKKSRENPLMFAIRKIYYHMVNSLSENELVSNFTGFGLYDKRVIEALKLFDDPYPYFRGLVSQVGFDKDFIEYVQPVRKAGKTKNNFYTLFDMAMLGFVNNSKLPLRAATIAGFSLSGVSFLVAVFYFIMKLIHWDSMSLGLAPLLIGIFFFSSVQLAFIGILGEYIGAIYTQVKHNPLVIEKERVNFD